MNMLIDVLPDEITVDGTKYAINSDFRTSMLFELMMSDKELDDKEKIENALMFYYPIIPQNIKEAMDQILWFYRCGRDMIKSKGSGSGKNDQIYDFNFDDEYIYSAFLDQYGIDLQDADLHWWKFKALFKSLKEDNEIVKIMGYRSMDLSKIKDKEEKTRYKKMKELYKIQNHASEDETEKLAKIQEALQNGGDISELLQK